MKTLADYTLVEDRYQSAGGLLYDLNQYKGHIYSLDDKGMIDFYLGKNDVSLWFSIPEKLYGREKEVNKLYAVYEQVTTGCKQFMLVNGISGIGKTASYNRSSSLRTPHKYAS